MQQNHDLPLSEQSFKLLTEKWAARYQTISEIRLYEGVEHRWYMVIVPVSDLRPEALIELRALVDGFAIGLLREIEDRCAADRQRFNIADWGCELEDGEANPFIASESYWMIHPEIRFYTSAENSPKSDSLKTEECPSFTCKGDSWQVLYEGKETVIRNRERLRYLITLIENPNVVFSPTELAGLVKGAAIQIGQVPQEIGEWQLVGNLELDPKFCQYEPDSKGKSQAERITDLIHNAWKEFRSGKMTIENWELVKKTIIEEYKIIIDDNKDQLRYRHLSGGNVEFINAQMLQNARTNVKKNIDAARNDCSKIPQLLEHLKRSIRTGSKICYAPGEHAPQWSIKR